MSDWKDEARALAAQHSDWSQARIAEVLGRTPSAVWKALNPERTRELNAQQNARRHEVKLAWQREADAREENRLRCPRCGGLMAKGSFRRRNERGRKHELCAACRHASRVNRAREIERLWAAGESMLAIAAHLGWARGTLSAELDWMRRNGFDVPHRYTMRKRMAA